MYANVRAISKTVLTARTGTVQLSYHTLSKFDVLAKKDKKVQETVADKATCFS